MARGKSTVDKLSDLREQQRKLREKEKQLQMKVDTEIATVVKKKLNINDPAELATWIESHIELEEMFEKNEAAPDVETETVDADDATFGNEN